MGRLLVGGIAPACGASTVQSAYAPFVTTVK
jgi:hypothetical protein